MSALVRSLCLASVLVALANGRADEVPPIVTLKGHEGWVGWVAFSPDGKRLATASADRTVRTWAVKGGLAAEVLKGHTDHVGSVAFGADGLLVSGGFDGTVRLWRAKKEPLTLDKRRGAVLTVAVSPDGKTAAAGGIDGVVTLLDLSGDEKPVKLAGHKSWVNSLAFAADGKRLLSGSSDGTARLWDRKTNKPIKSFALSDPREIRGVALSHDGKMAAAAVRFGSVKAWDVVTGKELAGLDAHEGESWSVCFAPDNKTLISGGGDWGKPGTVKLWDTTTWKERATLAHPAEVLCVAVSGDGKRLAVSGAGRTVRVWDLRAAVK